MFKKAAVGLSALFACISLAWGAVNINTANESELTSLPGIGPSKAKAIVEYRKAHGNFKAIEDIQKVKGIGPATYESLKSELTVAGAAAKGATAEGKSKK
ncbi:MAG: helix-hairpin-helix domain-containing protein [Rhodocyclaceae bacterium]